MTPLLDKVLSRLTAGRLLGGIQDLESPCPSLEELAAYLDGLLRCRERREIEAHLAGCAGCRAAIIELRHILRALETEPSDVPGPILQAARNIVRNQCASQVCTR